MTQRETTSKAHHALSPSRPVRVESPAAGERLTLRQWQEDDREALLAIFARSRAHFDRYSPLHHPGENDSRTFERQLRLARTGDESLSGCRRLAVLDDGTIVGAFNLNQISRGLIFEADANWWVDAAQCGRGFGTAGVRMLLDHALDDLPEGLGLHRVTCGIVPEHAASERIARRTGFARQEGITSHLQIGDQWVRHAVYVATHESVAARSAA